MDEPIKVTFRQWDCEVQRVTYANGRAALLLVHGKDREPFAAATVNLPDVPLGPNEVFVKDWGENAGMLSALADAGIVRDTGARAATGYVSAAKVEIIHPQLVASYERDVAGRRSGGARAEGRGPER